MISSKPNILLIHADQHRFDCLGAYGNKDIRTPNIDSLAGDGVLYQNSFCSYPVCTPSRYSLLCGLYVHQHRGWSNVSSLAPGIATFPKILRENGYRTKAVGKMHFTPTYLDVGFDEMILSEQCGNGRYDDDYHRWLKDEDLFDGVDLMDQVFEYRNDAPQKYWETYGALTSDMDEEHYSTTWIGNQAVDELETWTDNGGNLLMVGFIKPHHPFDPPAPWDRMYDPGELTLLDGWSEESVSNDVDYNAGYFPHKDLTERVVRRIMAYYYATISQIDHHVGRMIDALKQRGLYEKTLIIYTSDHGDYMGYHHLMLKGNYMYDPLTKVPLIIKYPGNLGSGKTDPRLVNNIDIMPTVLNLANCPLPHNLPGCDLRNPKATHDYVFTEGGQSYMVRSERHKLLLCRDDRFSQFFDLQDDPLEYNNLYRAPEYQEQIKSSKQALSQWSLFTTPPPNYLDTDAPTIRSTNAVRHGSPLATGQETYFRKRMTGFELE